MKCINCDHCETIVPFQEYRCTIRHNHITIEDPYEQEICDDFCYLD